MRSEFIGGPCAETAVVLFHEAETVEPVEDKVQVLRPALAVIVCEVRLKLWPYEERVTVLPLHDHLSDRGPACEHTLGTLVKLKLAKRRWRLEHQFRNR